MHFIVKFTSSGRRTPIYSKYRPDWTSDSKPEYNCGTLIFEDQKMISPGEIHTCQLHPMRPDLWTTVKIGDVLKCMEGSKQVGEAIVESRKE